MKKEPTSCPPAPTRRRKRSTKSVGENSQQETSKPIFKDSPFPERQKRGYNIISPARPPRRGSSSSLVDQYKYGFNIAIPFVICHRFQLKLMCCVSFNRPPSIAPSDGTQYEEIDDELENDDNEQFYPLKIDPQNRPLPAPPRPPREKRRRRKTNVDKKFDDDEDAEMVAGSFDDSEFSTREFVGAEMATQTSLDIDDLYLNEDVPVDDITTEQYTKTVEEIIRDSDTQNNQTKTPSDDNLMKGIQKFRESNQRSYSERSRASTERQLSRPLTPSTLLIEQRITRSPVQTDAALIMQPVNDPTHADYRTDSAESEYVPYVDEIDDTQIDTEDERIINAAIRRYQYQMSSNENEGSSERRDSPPKTTDKTNVGCDETSTIEVPQPPPRRKSSTTTTQITEMINVPLAEPETLSVASTQELNRLTPEPVNDLSADNLDPAHTPVESLTVVNIQATNLDYNEEEKPEHKVVSGTQSNFQITPEVMREIIERVRETIPAQTPVPQTTADSAPTDPEVKDCEEPASKKDENRTKSKEETKQTDEPPERPPTPTNYHLTTEIPASFYQLRTGISEDESSIPPAAVPKHRPRKHNRRPESSSDEECSRRHHHHHHLHHPARGQDLSIVDLSGQLIRACGRALSSSLSTAGHSLVDFLRSLTKNQDDHQKDLSLVLLILIIIVASLMMLGISGDRSVHHHHWDYFNPPDNIGRR